MKKNFIASLTIGMFLLGVAGMANANAIADDFNDGDDVGWQHNSQGANSMLKMENIALVQTMTIYILFLFYQDITSEMLP